MSDLPDLERVLHGTLLGEGLLAAEVAALVADDRGFYIAANDEVCRLTGYSREQLTTFRAGQLAADEPSRAIYRQLVRRRKAHGTKNVRTQAGSVVECGYWGIPTTITRLPYFVVLLWPLAPV